MLTHAVCLVLYWFEFVITRSITFPVYLQGWTPLKNIILTFSSYSLPMPGSFLHSYWSYLELSHTHIPASHIPAVLRSLLPWRKRCTIGLVPWICETDHWRISPGWAVWILQWVLEKWLCSLLWGPLRCLAFLLCLSSLPLTHAETLRNLWLT